jgi:hypothetical protein
MKAPLPSQEHLIAVRLIGSSDAVAALVMVLMATTDVETVTPQIPARRPGHVRVYLTTTRRNAYSGGIQ